METFHKKNTESNKIEGNSQYTMKEDLLFQELISKISSKFTGLFGDEFENAIQDILAEIGLYFKVDTVRLYRLSLEGEVIKFRLSWRNERLAPPSELSEIGKMKYPELADHYSKGKTILFNKLDDIPPWPKLRKILEFFGTRAGVGVPIEVDSSGVDIFAMDNVLSEHDWPKEIIEQSNAIGKVLLSTMRRREAEIKLQDSLDIISLLKEHLEQENVYFQEEIEKQKNLSEIIGQSTSLTYVMKRLEQVAPTDATVLFQSETGTGKELFASALHRASRRKHKPLIKVGCASLSSNLIESEFFGHEKGAFTGADKQRIGRFELADKGTIFLDEISELSIELQSKLLRVLQEGEFERLGSSKTIHVDVRVIAATNRNLEEEIAKGNFRKDLYYRLTTFILTIPPLRERKDDIPLLAKYFLNKYGKKHRKKIKTIPKTSLRNLMNYSWPGNIRELENVMERAVIISENGILLIEIPESSILSEKGGMKLKDVERNHIIQVLESTNWRLGGIGGAAELLGLKRTTLHEKIKSLEIER